MTKTRLACLLSFSLLFATQGAYADNTDIVNEGASTSTATPANKISDEKVKDIILKDYLTYHIKDRGPCPCPEMKAKNSSKCGAHSAWSRKENKDVLCYRSDVTDDMVSDWRENQSNIDEGDNKEHVVKTKRDIRIEKKVDDFLDKYAEKYDVTKSIKPVEIKTE